MGAFSSLVCDVWKRSRLKPDRGQGVMKGGQERKWFKATNGGIGSEGNRVSVTIQRIVARLGLSQSGVKFSACLEVSFLGGLEPFRQFVPVAV